jgi:uncharacterized Zn-finger protein
VQFTQPDDQPIIINTERIIITGAPAPPDGQGTRITFINGGQSGREGTHRRPAAAVEHQSIGSRIVSLANCQPKAQTPTHHRPALPQVSVAEMYPKFHNEVGVPIVRIGCREFKCIGDKPPQDHPHVYLNMGDASEIVCPYCSTLFRFDQSLGAHEADPADCAYGDMD